MKNFAQMAAELEHVANAMLAINARTAAVSPKSLHALLTALREMRAALHYIEISTRRDGQWAEQSVCAFAKAALAKYPAEEEK